MNNQYIHTRNATYQKFEVLKTNRNKRYKYGEFIVEGVRNINQAIKSNWSIKSFIYSQKRNLSDWAKTLLETVDTEINYSLNDELMTQLSDKTDTSELIAIVRMKDDNFNLIQLSAKPLIVLFDRPSNKGNLGTLIRSCDALGVDSLIITGHSVDLYDPEVILASMGSFFNLPVIRIADNNVIDIIIKNLKSNYNGFQVIATTAHKKTPVYQEKLQTSCIVLIGNETDGLCHNLYEKSDISVSIPMAESSSASSFNVACAATVIIYEIIRQRKETKEFDIG